MIVILTHGWIYLSLENGSICKMHKLIKAWYLYRNHLRRESNGATWEFLCKGFQQQHPIHTTKFVVSTTQIAITRLALCILIMNYNIKIKLLELLQLYINFGYLSLVSCFITTRSLRKGCKGHYKMLIMAVRVLWENVLEVSNKMCVNRMRLVGLEFGIENLAIFFNAIIISNSYCNTFHI